MAREVRARITQTAQRLRWLLLLGAMAPERPPSTGEGTVLLVQPAAVQPAGNPR